MLYQRFAGGGLRRNRPSASVSNWAGIARRRARAPSQTSGQALASGWRQPISRRSAVGQAFQPDDPVLALSAAAPASMTNKETRAARLLLFQCMNLSTSRVLATACRRPAGPASSFIADPSLLGNFPDHQQPNPWDDRNTSCSCQCSTREVRRTSGVLSFSALGTKGDGEAGE